MMIICESRKKGLKWRTLCHWVLSTLYFFYFKKILNYFRKKNSILYLEKLKPFGDAKQYINALYLITAHWGNHYHFLNEIFSRIKFDLTVHMFKKKKKKGYRLKRYSLTPDLHFICSLQHKYFSSSKPSVTEN